MRHTSGAGSGYGQRARHIESTDRGLKEGDHCEKTKNLRFGVFIADISHSLLRSNWQREEGDQYYEFSGDQLTLFVTNMIDGKLTPKSSSTVRVVWERVKL